MILERELSSLDVMAAVLDAYERLPFERESPSKELLRMESCFHRRQLDELDMLDPSGIDGMTYRRCKAPLCQSCSTLKCVEDFRWINQSLVDAINRVQHPHATVASFSFNPVHPAHLKDMIDGIMVAWQSLSVNKSSFLPYVSGSVRSTEIEFNKSSASCIFKLLILRDRVNVRSSDIDWLTAWNEGANGCASVAVHCDDFNSSDLGKSGGGLSGRLISSIKNLSISGVRPSALCERRDQGIICREEFLAAAINAVRHRHFVWGAGKLAKMPVE